MSEADRDRARSRALRTAQVVTLGLALAGTASGCEAATNAYCDVFSQNRFCCERVSYQRWDPATHTCNVMAVPGPIVGPMPTS